MQLDGRSVHAVDALIVRWQEDRAFRPPFRPTQRSSSGVLRPARRSSDRGIVDLAAPGAVQEALPLDLVVDQYASCRIPGHPQQDPEGLRPDADTRAASTPDTSTAGPQTTAAVVGTACFASLPGDEGRLDR